MGKWKEWAEGESNSRHTDFQSVALPAELSARTDRREAQNRVSRGGLSTSGPRPIPKSDPTTRSARRPTRRRVASLGLLVSDRPERKPRTRCAPESIGSDRVRSSVRRTLRRQRKAWLPSGLGEQIVFSNRVRSAGFPSSATTPQSLQGPTVAPGRRPGCRVLPPRIMVPGSGDCSRNGTSPRLFVG